MRRRDGAPARLALRARRPRIPRQELQALRLCPILFRSRRIASAAFHALENFGASLPSFQQDASDLLSAGTCQATLGYQNNAGINVRPLAPTPRMRSWTVTDTDTDSDTDADTDTDTDTVRKLSRLHFEGPLSQKERIMSAGSCLIFWPRPHPWSSKQTSKT